VTLEVEQVPPQAPVRVAAQEALAESDEAGYLKYIVGGKMMGLQPVEEQKPTKKFVGGK
jgi:hypothetical protein